MLSNYHRLWWKWKSFYSSRWWKIRINNCRFYTQWRQNFRWRRVWGLRSRQWEVLLHKSSLYCIIKVCLVPDHWTSWTHSLSRDRWWRFYGFNHAETRNKPDEVNKQFHIRINYSISEFETQYVPWGALLETIWQMCRIHCQWSRLWLKVEWNEATHVYSKSLSRWIRRNQVIILLQDTGSICKSEHKTLKYQHGCTIIWNYNIHLLCSSYR